MPLNDALTGSVTIMGLGVHGGGAASAAFFVRRGAAVTVTDLRSAEALAPSLKALEGLPIRYVLGKHREEDFRNADLVIKNPGVPASSPYLAMAKRIETDISIFLSLVSNPIAAVTGSKGKSFTASAIQAVLQNWNPAAKLGGNITVSPLKFLDDLKADVPVVLELSSWQLGDLRKKGVLDPKAAVITTILPDHQDYYGSMEPYIADKKVIFESQSKQHFTVLNSTCPVCCSFRDETPGTPVFFSNAPLAPGEDGAYLSGPDGEGFFRHGGREELIVPRELAVPGSHQRLNLLAAALTGALWGLPPDAVARTVSRFKGIPHRLEWLEPVSGVKFYNDSAATIPQAVEAAVSSFREPVHLITGGTDKGLDFSVFKKFVRKPSSLFLLEGTGTEKIIPVLREERVPWKGPYSSLNECVQEVFRSAKPGETVLFSPGCTSFGMFRNEFHRGDCFKEAVKSLA
jgi:UDP-N-acetylmuramoylalanine--D-glutamate ligase